MDSGASYNQKPAFFRAHELFLVAVAAQNPVTAALFAAEARGLYRQVGGPQTAFSAALDSVLVQLIIAGRIFAVKENDTIDLCCDYSLVELQWQANSLNVWIGENYRQLALLSDSIRAGTHTVDDSYSSLYAETRQLVSKSLALHHQMLAFLDPPDAVPVVRENLAYLEQLQDAFSGVSRNH